MSPHSNIIDLQAARGRRSLLASLDHLEQALSDQRDAVSDFREVMHDLDREIGVLGGLWAEYQREVAHIHLAPLKSELERLAKAMES